MNTPPIPGSSERREGSVQFDVQGATVQAGFRCPPGELLAGAPLVLEFFIDSTSASPLRLAIAGDRARLRPGQFSFEATFDGEALEDPMAAWRDAGGPLGMIEIAAGLPWQQPLLLNQFINLDATPSRLQPGATGRLAVACRRPLVLEGVSGDPAAASFEVSIDLGLDLRRDDAALAAVAVALSEAVLHGNPAARLPAFEHLLAMRGAARAQLELLSRHPDAGLAEPARRAIAALRR